MAPWDAVSLILMFILAVRGSIVGFVVEFFSKAAVILGALGAAFFYRSVTPYVVRFIGSNAFPGVVAFLSLFLVIYLLVKLLQYFAGAALQGKSLGSLDRALGFFLGLLEGAIAVIILLLVIHAYPKIAPDNILSGSLVDRVLTPLIERGPSIVSGFFASKK